MSDDRFDELAELINKMKDLVESLCKDQHMEDVVQMLERSFGVSSSKAGAFINTIMDMEDIGIPYDALPLTWFFKGKKLRFTKNSHAKKVQGELPRGHARKIAEERIVIVDTISKFRELGPENQEKALKFWPKDFRAQLEIARGASPTILANIILGNRWGVSEDTIQDYVKVHSGQLTKNRVKSRDKETGQESPTGDEK